MRRNPLLTPEYYRELYKFHRAHPGAIPPVITAPPKKKSKQSRKTVAGRKDASASAARLGGKPAGRNHKPSDGSGVGLGKQPGNSPSDCDGATMSRAPEAYPMCVDGDRQGR